MKPLKGYTNVTDQLITKPCEMEGCTKDAEIPTHYCEKERKFSGWYCWKHAYEAFSRPVDSSREE